MLIINQKGGEGLRWRFWLPPVLSIAAFISCIPVAVAELPAEQLEPVALSGDALDPGYEYRQKGMRALGDGIYSSAVRFFTAYRQRTGGNEPDFTDATILLLRAHLLRGDVEGARRDLDYYDEKSEGTDDDYYRQNLLFWRGAVLIREGHAISGLQIIERLLESELYPELQEQALLLMSDAYAGLARWQEASATIARFLKDFPDSALRQQALLDMVKIAVAMDDHAAAEEWLQKAAAAGQETPSMVLHRVLWKVAGGDLPGGLELYGKISAEAPLAYERTWWLVSSQLAQRLVAGEKWEEALPVLAISRRLAPSTEQRAEIVLLQAESQVAVEKADLAAATLRFFLSEFAEHEKVPEVRFRVAMLDARLGDLESAMAGYQSLLEDASLDTELRYGSGIERGRLAMQQRLYDEALNSFTVAHLLEVANDQRADALMLAGEVALAKEDFGAAIKLYQSVADTLGDTRHGATARLLQADTQVRENNHELAAEVYQNFLENHPDDARAPSAQLRQAAAWREAGRLEKSMEVFQTFASSHPEHDRAATSLMEIYRMARQQGDMMRSLQALERICLEYAETDLLPEALYHRIYVAFQVGDYDLAVTESERFITDFKRMPMTADILLWLGDYYGNQGDFARAENKYREVFLLFENRPQAAVALFEAAAAAFDQDDGADRALALLTQLEERYGNRQVDLTVLGRAAFLHGDILAARYEYGNAVAWFEKAGERLPEAELAMAAKGRAADMYFALGKAEDYARAARKYREILAGNQLSSELRENISYRLAKTMERLGELDEALDLYLDIVFTYDLEIRSGVVRDWFYFARAGYDAARILVEKGHNDAAARIYERIQRSAIPTSEEAGQRARQLRQTHRLEN